MRSLTKEEGGRGHIEPPKMGRWFKAWFALFALLGASMLAAVAYAVYLLFVHFGVVA